MRAALHEPEYIALLLVAGLAVLSIMRDIDPAWFFSAALFASVFSGHWHDMHIPVAVDRVLFIGGLVSLGVRRLAGHRTGRFILEPVHVVLLVLTAYAALSALAAGTLGTHAGGFALLDKLGVVPFAFFAVAPMVFATQRQRRILLGFLVVLAAYLGVTGLMEGIGHKSWTWPSYISNPAVGISVNFDRARGPFVEAAPNGFAMWVGIVTCGLAVVVWRRRSVTRAAAIVSVLCLVGIVATVTRQVWLAPVVSLVVLFVCAPVLRRRIAAAGVVGAALIVIALAVVPGLSQKATERAGENRPVWDRLNTTRAGLNMIAANPLTGVGWARFGAESDDYYQQAADYPLTTIGTLHSVALSNAVELGLVGLSLWALALFLAARRVFVRGSPELYPWRLAFIAVGAAWLFITNFNPFGYAYPNDVVWLLAGVAGIRASQTIPGFPGRAATNDRGPWRLRPAKL